MAAIEQKVALAVGLLLPASAQTVAKDAVDLVAVCAG